MEHKNSVITDGEVEAFIKFIFNYYTNSGKELKNIGYTIDDIDRNLIREMLCLYKNYSQHKFRKAKARRTNYNYLAQLYATSNKFNNVIIQNGKHIKKVKKELEKELDEKYKIKEETFPERFSIEDYEKYWTKKSKEKDEK